MNLTSGVDKLEGAMNFRSWRFAVKMLLIHEELYDVVEAEELKPEDVKRDQKALAKIALTVKANVYPHITNAKTSKEAWQALEKAYSANALQGRIHIMRKLFQTRRSQFQSVDDYVLEIMKLSQQLTEMDKAIDDELIAVILLSGLPPELDPLVMALENSDTVLTSELVKSKLLAEASRREEHDDERSDSALFVRKRATDNRIQCYSCKGFNHISRFCPNRPARNYDSNARGYNDNNARGYDTNARGSSDNNSRGSNENASSAPRSSMGVSQKHAFLTALKAEFVDSSSWFLDSGCTSHMTNLEPECATDITPAQIKTAGTELLQCIKRGDIEVFCTTGNKVVQNANFVPGLSANLLSVSNLSDKGMMTVFDKKRCYILDDTASITGDIVATGTRVGGLYKLDVDDAACLAARKLKKRTQQAGGDDRTAKKTSATTNGNLSDNFSHKFLTKKDKNGRNASKGSRIL